MENNSRTQQLIYLPRWVDEWNTNAQALNARSMLARFRSANVKWIAPYYSKPDSLLVDRPNLRLYQFLRKGLWRLHLLMQYQSPVDAIFYPGGTCYDAWGLLLRRLAGRRVPVIATLEGLAGDENRQREYSEWAKHPVFCQAVTATCLARLDQLYQKADHVIAISPFLAEMGRRRYGDKFSVIPLGIDRNIFNPGRKVTIGDKVRVVTAGNLHTTKRPAMFMELARRHPSVEFIWYGGGGSSELESLRQQIEQESLGNLSFPGSVQPRVLAANFRSSDMFVMPSISEGVPKVTQEAAACGLPVILFGYFEAPSIINGENGFVVWHDDEFYQRVDDLIADSAIRRTMGAAMAQEWSWDTIVPKWEAQILEVLNQ